MEVLFSTPALSIYSILFTLLMTYLVKKNYITKTYADTAVSLFQWIEENYLSTLNIKGQEKLEFFINDFVARYRNDFGTVPTQDIITNAVKIVEELVISQKEAIVTIIPPAGT